MSSYHKNKRSLGILFPHRQPMNIFWQSSHIQKNEMLSVRLQKSCTGLNYINITKFCWNIYCAVDTLTFLHACFCSRVFIFLFFRYWHRYLIRLEFFIGVFWPKLLKVLILVMNPTNTYLMQFLPFLNMNCQEQIISK